jgi:RIO kinase 1
VSDQTNPDVGPQPAPSWLIAEHYDDEDLGVLKEGKEATCSLVERTSRDDGRTHMLVAKRYRSVKHRAFRNDAMYRHRTGGSHADKAIRLRTDLGLEIQEHVRAEREFDVLSTLWTAGVAVPYPARRSGTDLLLELVGDGETAAPRLVAARVDPPAAREALDQVLDACADMLALGWVHGDLSPFNVLWHEERAVLIDFPQTMDLGTHPMALDVLHRDIITLCDWARRRGARAPDPDEAFARLLSAQFG